MQLLGGTGNPESSCNIFGWILVPARLASSFWKCYRGGGFRLRIYISMSCNPWVVVECCKGCSVFQIIHLFPISINDYLVLVGVLQPTFTL